MKFHLAPLIAFAALICTTWIPPLFMSELTWARGGGDLCILAYLSITLGLIWWERALQRQDDSRGFPVLERDA